MGKKDKRKQTDDEEAMLSLATLNEASAYMTSSNDIDAGSVPSWCELILDLKRMDDGTLKPAWPINARLPLRRHDGELIIEVLHNALHPNAGGAVVAGLWADLDAVMDRLMSNPTKSDRGLALGLTIALARVSNPYQPDEDAIRGIAVERWEARQV